MPKHYPQNLFAVSKRYQANPCGRLDRIEILSACAADLGLVTPGQTLVLRLGSQVVPFHQTYADRDEDGALLAWHYQTGYWPVEVIIWAG